MTDDPTIPPGWRAAIEELHRKKEAARAMGGRARLERQHAAGRLDARARIARLLDAGSFVELGALVGAEEGIAADGFVAGAGEIEGRVVLAFPIARLGAMPAAGAGGAVGADETLQGRLSASELGGVYRPADGMAYDDVIDPRELRNRLLHALGMAAARTAGPCTPVCWSGIRP